ncbi:PREDICTED: protein NDUFAF4 homolog isoform X2 [Nicrophorus vespilloides]|uniref:Protein NDUFAF4 homolog isoform X2 n=1 Tax=Nicrophorus vespilloides TaxID=110193 RepID=A0ABM1M4J3_NICVS|nr:PREDICTED: protein NDUFAF4 homolog isoform X2 [Nicrophorus vespilloides]
MGKALSTIRNPLRNFNLEGRAHAAVSKNKPTAAPKHKADQMNYEQILHDHPDIVEESRKKHHVLDKHLKDIYVISNDAEVIKEQDPNKPLPTDRKPVEDFEYGVKQPTIVPHGKITLKQALEFISQHQNNPAVWTSSKISDDYLLSEEKRIF